jgi:hypothetical protein
VFLLGTITIKGAHGKHMLLLNFCQLGLGCFLSMEIINKFALYFVGAMFFCLAVLFFVGMIWTEMKIAR